MKIKKHITAARDTTKYSSQGFDLGDHTRADDLVKAFTAELPAFKLFKMTLKASKETCRLTMFVEDSTQRERNSQRPFSFEKLDMNTS